MLELEATRVILELSTEYRLGVGSCRRHSVSRAVPEEFLCCTAVMSLPEMNFCCPLHVPDL